MTERWFHAGRYERECAAFDAANPLMAKYADDEIRCTFTAWTCVWWR